MSYKDLLDEVHRFKPDEKEIVMKILEKGLERGSDLYSRLVLVPMNHQYKLPNYIVAKREDLAGANDFMEQAESFGEIWHLVGKATEKDLMGMSEETCHCGFAGRISYSKINFGYVEIIEMVSGDDPRQLEKYSVKNNEVDYLRVIKMWEGSTYKIDSIHTGVNYKDAREWIQCFRQLEEELAKYRDRLYRLRRMINRYGIYSLSLDFVMKEHGLSFLDWDTSDDCEILKNESV